jgi:hypothetical protein
VNSASCVSYAIALLAKEVIPSYRAGETPQSALTISATDAEIENPPSFTSRDGGHDGQGERCHTGDRTDEVTAKPSSPQLV